MFNPQDPAFVQDPYPTYRALRERAPVHFSEALNGWMFTRHADVQRVMNHPKIMRPPAGDMLLGRVPADVRTSLQAFERRLATSMPFSNPPRHTRLRSVVAQAFNRDVAEGLRLRIQRRVQHLLDRLQDARRGELLEDYGYQIPTWVIMELCGLPQEDLPMIKELVTRITPIIGQCLPTDDPAGAATTAAAATEEFTVYLEGRIAEVRRSPREDLLSRLVEAPLTADEITLTVLILIIAGTETTTHYITNAIHTLLRHPRQLRMLRDDPWLIERAAVELLRFEGPVPFLTPEIVSESVVIGGVELQPGELVYAVIGAANRDPQQFFAPEELDLTRPIGGVLSFGGGIHFCIGRHLAQMEAQIAISAIVRRFPKLRHDDAEPVPVWRADPILRGLTALPVITC
ncbi:cytochrome P450 [Lentzea sp. NBRC 105346]|uniref:cytochrome P450 n=1 Tax=Lentzea sp. NBRC 105346 TaxID=3032205 RepID=UPI002557B4B9|nr:cytochrome P450 [Lentzea sp. NBRC 105346]